MTERIVLGIKDKEKLEHYRSAITSTDQENSNVREYLASRTEKFLEEICSSFGTELEQAYVNPLNGTKLVRVSKPVTLTHKQTGEKSLLAMQYTRFSPFDRDLDKVIEVYSMQPSRRKKSPEKIPEEIVKKIQQRDGEWDNFREITDPQFIPHAPIARYRKKLYFAVFNLGKSSDVPTQSFLIHEAGIGGLGLPDIHMTFQREPFFIANGRVMNQDKIDTLFFDFPLIRERHKQALETAFSLYNAKFKDNMKSTTLGVRYDVDSTARVDVTMAFIQSYLRRMTVDTVL